MTPAISPLLSLCHVSQLNTNLGFGNLYAGVEALLRLREGAIVVTSSLNPGTLKLLRGNTQPKTVLRNRNVESKIELERWM